MNQPLITGRAKAAARRVRKHKILAKALIAVIDFLTPRQPTFDLETGEEVLAKIDAYHSGGLGIYTPLLLTNRRLLWLPSPEGFVRLFNEAVVIPIDTVGSVDKGEPRDWLRARFDPRIGITLKSGKRHVLSVSYKSDSELDFFLKSTQSAISHGD